MGHAQVRHVRPVRGSASLGRMSPVPGPPRRPAAATPASARHPGQDRARDWHTHESAVIGGAKVLQQRGTTEEG